MDGTEPQLSCSSNVWTWRDTSYVTLFRIRLWLAGSRDICKTGNPDCRSRICSTRPGLPAFSTADATYTMTKCAGCGEKEASRLECPNCKK